MSAEECFESEPECPIDAFSIASGGEVELEAANLGKERDGHHARTVGRHSVADEHGLDGRDEITNR